MDPLEPTNEYHEYYATGRQSQPPHSPVATGQFPIPPPMATGPYASPIYPHPFAIPPSSHTYIDHSQAHYYSQHAARPTAGIYPYQEAATAPQEAHPVTYARYYDPRQPFQNDVKLEISELNVLNNVDSSARFPSRHSRSGSAVSEDVHTSTTPSSTRQLAEGPARDSVSYTDRSLAYNFPHRGASSSIVPSANHRESHIWDHTVGTSIPHSATPTSTTPSRQDFPIGADLQSSLRPWKKDPMEFMPPDETPSHSQHTARSSAPAATAPPSSLEEMLEYFPLNTPLHETLRLRLFDVMNSSWRRSNEKEPDPQILLQFTERVEENGFDKFRCLFFSDGIECNKNIPRADRMLEHLRRHVGVRPFTCTCNSDGCPGVFPSKSAMYQHQKNVEPVQCSKCGAQVLRQNLARHWRAQRCQRPDEDPYHGEGY